MNVVQPYCKDCTPYFARGLGREGFHVLGVTLPNSTLPLVATICWQRSFLFPIIDHGWQLKKA
jgi:hypothetical protein